MDTGKGDAHLHLPTLALLGIGTAAYLSAITVIKLAADNCSLLYARLATIALALAFIYFGNLLPPIPALSVFLIFLAVGVWLENRFRRGNLGVGRSRAFYAV